MGSTVMGRRRMIRQMKPCDETSKRPDGLRRTRNENQMGEDFYPFLFWQADSVRKCAFKRVYGDSSLITLLYISPSANLVYYSRTIVRSYDRYRMITIAHLVRSLRSSRNR